MRSDTSVLDNPVEASLRGVHAPLARRVGAAVGYRPDVCSFAALGASPSGPDWQDLAKLVGDGGLADLFSAPVTPPEEWSPEFSLGGVQMVRDACALSGRSATTGPPAPPDTAAGIAELTGADIPQMLALVEATRPGPFFPRTIDMGTYLGLWDNGRLLAMAGERLHPPGWTEISAVCTAPEARGRGLASSLIIELSRRILARGEQPFLHAVESNTGAIALYEQLGFRVRTQVRFHGYRVPAAR